MAETAFDNLLWSLGLLIVRYKAFFQHQEVCIQDLYKDLKLLRTFVIKMVEKNYHQNAGKILATKIDDANEKVANVLKSFLHEEDDTEEKLKSFIQDLTAISTGVQEICLKLPDIKCPPRADTIVVEDETVVTLQFGSSSTSDPDEETVVGFDEMTVKIVNDLIRGREEPKAWMRKWNMGRRKHVSASAIV
ncbi:unnamed protein product, partial [Ilex paraguariensis]